MVDKAYPIVEAFEKGLVAHDLASSKVKATVLGYGEISTVFEIAGLEGYACKRMPLFKDQREANRYLNNYKKYCNHLQQAVLTVSHGHTMVLNLEGRPVTLYIIQEKHKGETFAHKLLHTLTDDEILDMVRRIAEEILKIHTFNLRQSPQLALAIDGQLSNWVISGENIIYIDTSTPLYRIDGQEQLDPELFVRTAPSFLRWVIRLFFLDGVMDRYYNVRLVLLDLVANLYKEQRPDLIPQVLGIVNEHFVDILKPITPKEVSSYYREDKIIWKVFLAFRRLDRWINLKLLRKNYHYILPGIIKR